MREWYVSNELLGLEGMPSSLTGVAQKARRNNWLKRKASGQGRSYEYHISNFHHDVKKQLIEKYVTDPEEAEKLMNLPMPVTEGRTILDTSAIDKVELERFLNSDDVTNDELLWRGRVSSALLRTGDFIEPELRDLLEELVSRYKSIAGNDDAAGAQSSIFGLLRSQHVQRTNRLSESDKGKIFNVTELSNVKATKPVSEIGDMCAVPVYNVYASCGFGALGDAEYQIRTEFLPCDWLKRFGLTEDTARIIECHGDSMEDTLSDSDEVLVDIRELEHPVKHGVYVVRIGKHVYIKRLKYDIMAEGYEVISDNKELYPSFIVNGDKLQEFKVIGKVVTVVMKAIV